MTYFEHSQIQRVKEFDGNWFSLLVVNICNKLLKEEIEIGIKSFKIAWGKEQYEFISIHKGILDIIFLVIPKESS